MQEWIPGMLTSDLYNVSRLTCFPLRISTPNYLPVNKSIDYLPPSCRMLKDDREKTKPERSLFAEKDLTDKVDSYWGKAPR
jgi:hypothetical protein